MNKKCKTCYGYGFWAFGDYVPVGPMDAEDGTPTLPCPECGANPNPIDNCERTIKKRRIKKP
jgi:hypothetical protein